MVKVTKNSFKVVVLLLLWPMLFGCAELEKAVRAYPGLASGGSGKFDQDTVIAALKEALKVSSERTVSSASTRNGYLGNELIRIALPEELDEVAATLRKLGLGGEVEKLEVAMNRTAELAAGEAQTILWQSVRSMSIADAYGILNGKESAATDYFRNTTEGSLRQRYTPIVHAKMGEVGIYSLYRKALNYYQQIPFVRPPKVDLEGHITNQALNGLYRLLAEEEGKIRSDPAARSSELLRKVFAKAG